MKNKYLQDTKVKIAKYNRLKDMVELRGRDIALQQAMIDVTVDELERERIKRNIKLLNMEMQSIEKDIIAMDKGFLCLDATSYRIIDLKYRKKESWVAVALTVGYGQTRCKEIGKDALMIVGEYLHGLSIHQDLPLISGASCY